MPSYLEDTNIDTLSLAYPKTGIRLLKFVKTVYGLDVLEKIKKGDLIVWFNTTYVTFDENFRNYRVHPMTDVKVKIEEKYKDNEVPEDFFA